MKAKDVMKLLRITRQTLCNYVKNGVIKVRKLPNGRYDYDENSVYAFLHSGIDRKNVIYARVSTRKQKKDLENQILLLKNFCFQNGIKIGAIYSDIASGIDFENRKDFFLMLDDIFDGKVNNVIISYKDRLSRIGFNFFSNLFQKFGTEVIVISEVGSKKLDSEEIFEEIVSLLHCYSMKLYSKRKRKIIEEICNAES